MEISMIVYIVLGVAFIFYLWSKWIFSYWRRAGIPYLQTGFFEGPGNKLFKAFHHFKSQGNKLGGIFFFFKPMYVPTDVDLIEHISKSDASHFVNRGFLTDQPPIMQNLLNMEDNEWKQMRVKLTPTFTSGKLKMMFNIMATKGQMLREALKKQAIINEPVNLLDMNYRFVTDIIAANFFGLECNSVNDPTTDFRMFGEQMFKEARKSAILSFLPTSLLKIVGYQLFSSNVLSYFCNVVQNTFDYREKNNVNNKDFIQTMLELKQNGKSPSNKAIESDKTMLHVIVGQCMGMYGAAIDTSSNTSTCAMLELALNPKIQNKLRGEIWQVLKETDEILTYEGIMKMEYLDKVIEETLRKYTPVQFFPRKSNKDYPVPGTNIVIRKGEVVLIPFRALHHDPEHFPEPKKFDPERFSPENKAKRHRYAYLPFGEGPRMCIGARQGLLQVKIAVIEVINNFKITVNNKTPKPLPVDYSGLLLDFSSPILFDIERIE